MKKKKEYHQEIFCQLLRFFNSLCSYLSQKCVAKFCQKYLLNYTSFSKTHPVCSVNTN